MAEPFTVPKATLSPFPPRQKPPLKSQTFRSLFRILSLSSHLPPPRQLSDNVGYGAEKEVSGERISEQTELVGRGGGNQTDCVAEKGLGDIENLQFIGEKDGGFSDTQLVIDEIENMMRVEDDENELNEKTMMDECVEFRELQESLIDDLVHTVEGNEDRLCGNNFNSMTTLLDENKGGGDDDVFTSREKNFDPRPTDLKECNPVKQQVSVEENFGQIAPENVLASLNKSVLIESSTSIDRGDKSSKSRITGLDMDRDVQQSTIVPETSVCSSGLLISHDYGIDDDDDREEGEFSGDLGLEDGSAPTSFKDTLVLKKRADKKEVTDEDLDRSKIPLVEKDEVKGRESDTTLFMKTFDKYSSSIPVEAKESDRDEMKHKRKLVVYEDPILQEEKCQHKEQKRRVTKKQKKVSGANEHKKHSELVERMGGSVSRNVVTCPVSSSSNLALSSDNRDENAGTKDQDVVPCIKKKRGPLSEERKAKKKQQKRKKRAEKNRELGVKRLKLRPVVKPKPVTYCRHFLNGRCHEGEKCKFSHDTTPLTKSKPCCHFARHACMKGNDCPFDHQLSNYPCTSYASKGHCSRGDSCMFSHKLSKEDVPETSNISTPEAKSHSSTGISTSEKLGKTVTKSEANLLTVTPMAKGVRFLSSGKTPIADSSCSIQSSLSPKKNDVSKVENQKDQNALSSAQKLGDISKGITRTPPLKGINFLSFGKAPLASLTMSSTQTSLTGILQKNGIPRSSSSLNGFTDGLRNASVITQSSSGSGADSVQANTTPSDKQQNFNIIPKGLTTNPFRSGQSLDLLSHAFMKNTTVSSQKALMSTLAFAANIESEMKQNAPLGTSGNLTIDSAEASTK